MTAPEACQKAAELLSQNPGLGDAELLEALESVAQGHAVVVAVGNPFDGLTLFGPFCDGEEANEWAGDVVRDEWHSMAMLDPESHPI